MPSLSRGVSPRPYGEGKRSECALKVSKGIDGAQHRWSEQHHEKRFPRTALHSALLCWDFGSRAFLSKSPPKNRGIFGAAVVLEGNGFHAI